jgi:hypothetical protein
VLPVCEEVLPWIHKQSHELVLELHPLLSLSGVYGAHPTSTSPHTTGIYRKYFDIENICTLEKDIRFLTIAGYRNREKAFASVIEWFQSPCQAIVTPEHHIFRTTLFLLVSLEIFRCRFCHVYQDYCISENPLDEVLFLAICTWSLLKARFHHFTCSSVFFSISVFSTVKISTRNIFDL